MPIELVALKNGTEEAKGLVNVTMMSLQWLFQKKPIAFCELVMKCKDRNHKFFGNTEETLREVALIEADGNIHDSLCNIVLSAVQGEGLDMELISPIA